MYQKGKYSSRDHQEYKRMTFNDEKAIKRFEESRYASQAYGPDGPDKKKYSKDRGGHNGRYDHATGQCSV
jgi:hypothetical protein